MSDCDEEGGPADMPLFEAGAPVFDAGGEKIGTISERLRQRGYLVVRKGWLFRQNLRIPIQVVARNDAHGVYLNLFKDEVLNEDWGAPPVDESAASGTVGMAMRGTTTPVTSPGVGSLDPEVGHRGVEMGQETPSGADPGQLDRQQALSCSADRPAGITAPVHHDDVNEENPRVQRAARVAGPDAFVEQDFDIPLIGERLVVASRAVITDELRISKLPVTEERSLSGTVRKERTTVVEADDDA